jgi:hypothetical protein
VGVKCRKKYENEVRSLDVGGARNFAELLFFAPEISERTSFDHRYWPIEIVLDTKSLLVKLQTLQLQIPFLNLIHSLPVHQPMNISFFNQDIMSILPT